MVICKLLLQLLLLLEEGRRRRRFIACWTLECLEEEEDEEEDFEEQYRDWLQYVWIIDVQGKANGFKDFDTVHDIAFVDTEGVPFDQSFPF
jgi:hypothetical protein